MAEVSNDFGRNSSHNLSPDTNILDLVSERLLKPTSQQRTSKLQNYFLGYKEFLGQPPSPSPSDEGQLFSYSEFESKNLDRVPTSPPPRKVALQNPPEAESQSNLSTKKPKRRSNNALPSPKVNQGTQQNPSPVIERSRSVKAGRIVKAYSTPHQMETRSRARARRLLEIETRHRSSNGDAPCG